MLAHPAHTVTPLTPALLPPAMSQGETLKEELLFAPLRSSFARRFWMQSAIEAQARALLAAAVPV